MWFRSCYRTKWFNHFTRKWSESGFIDRPSSRWWHFPIWTWSYPRRSECIRRFPSWIVWRLTTTRFPTRISSSKRACRYTSRCSGSTTIRNTSRIRKSSIRTDLARRTRKIANPSPTCPSEKDLTFASVRNKRPILFSTPHLRDCLWAKLFLPKLQLFGIFISANVIYRKSHWSVSIRSECLPIQ